MKKTALLIACAGLIVGGIGMAAPQSANAGIRVSFGTGSYGYNRGYGYNQGYNNQRYGNYNQGYGFNQGYNNFNQGGFRGNSWSGGYGQSYHTQPGHYDYHPTTVVPHGSHLDVNPGHYDYHQGNHGYGH